MLLADIGNSRMHIYDGTKVVHLPHQEGIERYKDEKISYITVKHQLKEQLNLIKNWTDISDKIRIKNEYKGMGVDRKALCLSYPNGIFISVGSAITVDIVENKTYKGGFILLGLKSYIEAYERISPALKVTIDKKIDLNRLPVGTREGISYGIISSIKTIIESHRDNKKLYISGGDGKFLSSFFEEAIFDERLIFFGMARMLGNGF